jgi:hypothetical protein
MEYIQSNRVWSKKRLTTIFIYLYIKQVFVFLMLRSMLFFFCRKTSGCILGLCLTIWTYFDDLFLYFEEKVLILHTSVYCHRKSTGYDSCNATWFTQPINIQKKAKFQFLCVQSNSLAQFTHLKKCSTILLKPVESIIVTNK